MYEGLLMLQHRGQDSAGMVTTDWSRFIEHKANGLVRDVFAAESVMRQLVGAHPYACALRFRSPLQLRECTPVRR